MANFEYSLIYRIGAGKALGMIIGVIGFFALTLFVQDVSLLFRSGVLLWYLTMGAFIGIFGIFSHHPIFNFPLPWWFRGALIGAWMNFVLTLLAYEQIAMLAKAFIGEHSMLASPLFIVVEGALLGLCIDYLLTRWFGDGCLDISNS